MTLLRRLRALFFCVLCLSTFSLIVTAQIKPGRDPNQPIDQDYTNKIRDYTTAPYFNSPLTAYLPASTARPSPAESARHQPGPWRCAWGSATADCMASEDARQLARAGEIGFTEARER